MVKKFCLNGSFTFFTFLILIHLILPLRGQEKEKQGETGKNDYRRSLFLDIGYGSYTFRDAASIKSLGMEASPTKLKGNNTYFDLLYKKERKYKVRQIGFSFNLAKNFQYDSGIKVFKRPKEDQCTEARLRYALAFYIFKNAFIRNFDVGIGPQVELGYRQMQRNFSSDIKIQSHEWLLTPTFVISCRYSPLTFLQFQASLGNGIIVGLARIHYNQYGFMPGPKLVVGFTTDIDLSIWCLLGQKINVGLRYKSVDQGTYRMIAINSMGREQFILSLGYALEPYNKFSALLAKKICYQRLLSSSAGLGGSR